jgi:hypothetical protein
MKFFYNGKCRGCKGNTWQEIKDVGDWKQKRNLVIKDYCPVFVTHCISCSGEMVHDLIGMTQQPIDERLKEKRG